jgi:quercetin dioxygenase-like cupin family protein
VEFVFVLAGELVIEVAEERFQLSAGDAFTFPPTAAHAFWASESSGPVRVLWVITPALPDAMSGRGR